MQYKTITLQLIRDKPRLHQQLRSTRQLLPALDLCSLELKAAHHFWTRELTRQLTENPPESATQSISSQAMELAVAELEDLLPSELAEGESMEMALARRRLQRD